MNNQILFIYESKSLFDIFSEIEDNLNFKVINLTKKEISQINFKDYRDYLILSLKDLKLPNMILDIPLYCFFHLHHCIIKRTVPMNTYNF